MKNGLLTMVFLGSTALSSQVALANHMGSGAYYSWGHINDNDYWAGNYIFSIYYEVAAIRGPVSGIVDVGNSCDIRQQLLMGRLNNNNIAGGSRKAARYTADPKSAMFVWDVVRGVCDILETPDGAYYGYFDDNNNLYYYSADKQDVYQYPAYSQSPILLDTPSGVKENIRVNSNGYIAMDDVDHNVYYYTPYSTAPNYIDGLDHITAINNQNVILGAAADGCYIYDIDNAQLTKIEGCPEQGTIKSLSNNGLVAYYNNTYNIPPTVYRIATGETFLINDLLGSSGIPYFSVSSINSSANVLGRIGSIDRVQQLYLPPFPLKEFIIDNSSKDFQTSSRWTTVMNEKGYVVVPLSDSQWQTDVAKSDYYGQNYVKVPSSDDAHKASWSATVEVDGYYDVDVRYPYGVDNNTEASYHFNSPVHNEKIVVNQQLQSGQWVSIGDYYLTKGMHVIIDLSNNGNGETVADAVRIKLRE